jgi:putative endonuclease
MTQMATKLNLYKQVLFNCDMTWILYLLECKNGAYYAGITNNLESRFLAHQTGKGARYTRANPPIKIIASKLYVDRSTASVAEAQLKNLPRNKKLQYFNE